MSSGILRDYSSRRQVFRFWVLRWYRSQEELGQFLRRYIDDESVGKDTGGGSEGGGARPDAPAAGSDGNNSDSDDEEINGIPVASSGRATPALGYETPCGSTVTNLPPSIALQIPAGKDGSSIRRSVRSCAARLI